MKICCRDVRGSSICSSVLEPPKWIDSGMIERKIFADDLRIIVTSVDL